MAKIKLDKQIKKQVGTVDTGAISLTVKDLFIGDIYIKSNLRKDYKNIYDLKTSIKKYGLLNPITIYREKDNYFVKTGHRRLKAFKDLHQEYPNKFSRIRCILSDHKNIAAIQLVENIQRENLSPVEFKVALMDMRKKGLTVKQIAEVIGKSQQYVKDIFTAIKTIESDKDYQKLLGLAGTTLGHFKETQSIKNKWEKTKAIKSRASGKISRNQLRKALSNTGAISYKMFKIDERNLEITIQVSNIKELKKVVNRLKKI